MTALGADALLREVVRFYVRGQRTHAKCGDETSTVRCHVLTELLRAEGMPQQALVERLGLDKGWISRAVDMLVKESCISKLPSEQDRRSVVLFLTPEGRARARELEQELNNHAAQLLEHVPQDRHVQVQESLQLLLNALSAATSSRAQCSTLAVRLATSQDWPAIKRMLLAEELPLDGAQEHLAHFVVGEAAGKVVCAGGLEVYGADALLRSIVVDAESRGKQWAEQILARLTEQALHLNVSTLYLLTTTAESYFSRLGFLVVSRDRIPEQLIQSREFQGACPASAIAMKMRIFRSPS
ncbi:MULTISPECIES: arsenic resistance N-acetyltransferase ArsN2 [unclassified Duganella]|uniref:arsenic resistance N-acetyltransferase ArsN2 n=1 Tax=unclassified Duganella TaxID=2636909 RepID=UPI000889D694|nr:MULTISPECIES: arsenic resistance N-acetyltransferase ArsN2 [unclassified Duganella]SDG81895.1 N-acetylglutamate synthase, GNAT family [Duganella sp. OV458]SDK09328.1 N-acetylglutamate synthase, GNAT family [Duganella sp. OV510]